MNELKPEDVIRALELCVESVCDDCPYADNNFCRDDMMRTALALLREKDETIKALDALMTLKDSVIEKHEAYIDNLNDDKACLVEQIEKQDAAIASYILQIADMQREIACQADLITFLEKHKKAEDDKDAEIERLKSDLQIWKDIAHRETRYVVTARDDAINEFAKELTSELIRGGIYPVFVKGAIERTAKKLKGETDDSNQM